MPNYEKIAFPLIVVGAVAGIYAVLRRPAGEASVSVPPSRDYINGSDPATIEGESYSGSFYGQLANVRTAMQYPWSSATGYNAGVAPINGQGLPIKRKKESGSCGCGQGSSCGCLAPCPNGVRFVDGHGNCLKPETDVPSPAAYMHQLIDTLYNPINGVSLPESA